MHTPASRKPLARSPWSLVIALAVLAVTLSVPGDAAAQASRYRVTFSDDDRRIVKVEARITTRDSVLLFFLENYDAGHLPDGWATFVRGLEVSDAQGQRLVPRPFGKGRWVLPRRTAGDLSLRYEILVHHDQGYWPVGWDEAAYAKRECDCVFMTGMSLFIGAGDLGETRIEFSLPGPRSPTGEGWTSVTPWEPADAPHAYLAADFRELSEVAFVVGRVPTAEIVAGGARVRLAVGRGLPGALPLMQRSVTEYLRWAEAVFQAPATGRFAVIANNDVFTGGGAFIRSASMLFREPPSETNRRQWGSVLAHELLHLWNGMGMEFGAEEEWFKEGVTDYLAWKAMLYAGHSTPVQFMERVAESAGYYAPAAGARSLRQAGLAKQQNYPLVYNGGAMFAFVLDVELRRSTAGARGLEDVVAALYAQRRASRVSDADIAAVASAVAGRDLDGMFDRFVRGTEVIPVGEYLAAISDTTIALRRAVLRVGGGRDSGQAAAPSIAPATSAPATVNVYLDCTFCDYDFVRTDIPYVNWVRDRAVADVHVLATTMPTGGGGSDDVFRFIGVRGFMALADSLAYAAAVGATVDKRRRGHARLIARGLVPFLSRTALAERLSVAVTELVPGSGLPALGSSRDAWRGWVFNLAGTLHTSGEQSYAELNTAYDVQVSRTTEQWKTVVGGTQAYGRTRSTVPQGSASAMTDTTYVTLRRRWEGYASQFRAIAPHWSLGVSGVVGSDTYANQQLAAHAKVAVEYNVFPFSEATTRQLRFVYGAGAAHYRYQDTTIYLRTRETVPIHFVALFVAARQRWGDVGGYATHDVLVLEPSKRSTVVSGSVNLRIARGLGLTVGGQYDWIRDQLYLRKGDASTASVLLRQHAQRTSYSYRGNVGLSYTFGSIFNNVVFPRFGGTSSL